MNERYLTVQEFAERFRYSTDTVYRLLERGEVAHIGMKPYRIPESEVRAFADRNLRRVAEPKTPQPKAARPARDYTLKILKRP